jgi:hypothetical protein
VHDLFVLREVSADEEGKEEGRKRKRTILINATAEMRTFLK